MGFRVLVSAVSEELGEARGEVARGAGRRRRGSGGNQFEAVMILLQFTRDVGHPHPHLEDAIGNYLGFLETRGFDPAHVEAKLMSAHAEAGIAPSTHPVAEPSP